jgi:hypothetical protein
VFEAFRSTPTGLIEAPRKRRLLAIRVSRLLAQWRSVVRRKCGIKRRVKTRASLGLARDILINRQSRKDFVDDPLANSLTGIDLIYDRAGKQCSRPRFVCATWLAQQRELEGGLQHGRAPSEGRADNSPRR